MSEEKSNQKTATAIGFATALILVAGYKYFNMDTRWKLSGTWECHQDNGARTTEEFGLFGSQTTLNTNGAYKGIQIFGSYSLNGTEIYTTSKALKRVDGEVKKFDEIQWLRLTWDIAKLTNDPLSYTAKSPDKGAYMECIRKN
jgi:hypothetical protein